ncbi:MAG: FAD-dependent oxidoreductase [Candidatus Bipolaricaulia bacterium]
MEKVDVVIVGAGLAGLATAYSLADEGLEILVVERGDYPGSKNVTGGRLYLNPLRNLFDDEFWAEAPWERYVAKEGLTMMGEGARASLQFTSERFQQPPHHSWTILRAKFDQWFAERARERGVFIITKNRVDDLIIDDGRVAGVRAGEAEILADVVVAADGALSFTAEKAGLRERHRPESFAVGIKEVIELPREAIEERFSLEGEEGAAQLFFGSLTKGVFGGGFLYTNRESISLGIVLGLAGLMEVGLGVLEAHELLEEFRESEPVARLVEGGEAVEYSAHLIPESRTAKLYADGILVVGDAAGLALNMGLTVRGMDYALASGALAARAIKRAHKMKDFSASALSYYEDLLKESFVLQELHAFRRAVGALTNPRLFNLYPQVICGLLERLYWVDESPKPRLSATLRGYLRSRKDLTLSSLCKDLAAMRKI